MRHRPTASVIARAAYCLAASPLRAGGDLDPGFGTDGKVVLDAGAALYETQSGLARDSAGNLYIAGRTAAEYDDPGDFVVAKLDAAGVLMASFGVNGKAVVDFGGDDAASVVVIDASVVRRCGLSHRRRRSARRCKHRRRIPTTSPAS